MDSILERNKKWRHSPTGGKSPLNILRERYRSMVKRTTLERHSSTPEGLCSKEEFIKFGMENAEYHRLYEVWKNSGFPRGLSPSVDRIDVSRGYSLDNIQFLTFKENVAKSHKELTRQKILVKLIKNEKVLEFSSAAEAARFLGLKKSTVRNAAKNGRRARGWSVVSADTPNVEKSKRHQKVLVKSDTDELLFQNVKEAALFLGIAESTLRINIRKGYTIKKQYIAEYKD